MNRCSFLVLPVVLVASASFAQSSAQERTERMQSMNQELEEMAARVESLVADGSFGEAAALANAEMTEKLSILYAESAAPFEVSGKARIVDLVGITLREGSNGWTCIPVPGEPMCLDEQWMAWWDVMLQGGDELQIDEIGFAYMLAGDHGASNISRAETLDGPTADNDWVVTGPHLMLLSPDPALLESLPDDPAAGGPYVMWRGTALEHVMIPIVEGSVAMPYGQ